jgi:hypothetical protein
MASESESCGTPSRYYFGPVQIQMRLIAHSFCAETFAIGRLLRAAHLERRLVVPDLASKVCKWQ